MTQSLNLPDGMVASDIPGCSAADEAIDIIISELCDICISDRIVCPVNGDTALCPCNVVEKANYEYYHGSD